MSEEASAPQTIEERFQALEDLVKQQQAKIEELESDNTKLKHDIHCIKYELRNVKEEVKPQAHDLKCLKHEMRLIKTGQNVLTEGGETKEAHDIRCLKYEVKHLKENSAISDIREQLHIVVEQFSRIKDSLDNSQIEQMRDQLAILVENNKTLHKVRKSVKHIKRTIRESAEEKKDIESLKDKLENLKLIIEGEHSSDEQISEEELAKIKKDVKVLKHEMRKTILSQLK